MSTTKISTAVCKAVEIFLHMEIGLNCQQVFCELLWKKLWRMWKTPVDNVEKACGNKIMSTFFVRKRKIIVRRGGLLPPL